MTQRNGLAKQKENVEVLCLSYNLATGQTWATSNDKLD